MNQSFTIAANHGIMGGGEVMLLALATAARELGRDVTVVAPAEPSDVLTRARELGLTTVAIPGRGTAQYLVNLRRWDRTERRGVLWCNGLRPALATAGHPDRVVHLHQEPLGKLAAAAWVARLGALGTVVPSQSLADRVPGSEVLWNWTPPVPERPSRSLPRRGPITVGFLGRLSSDKGVAVLCHAIERLNARTPGRYRLLLAGESRFVDAEDAERIDDAIARLGDAAERRGWMDRDDFFAEVDLAVFPSVWAEPFGLVVSEAMSARCPFVVSDAGALPEVAGSDYPFIARGGDAKSLASVIERATDADWLDQLDASFERWQANFTPEAGRERLHAYLDRIDPATLGRPRVVVAHDYLTQRGGAERVTLNLLDAFPEAPLVTSLYNPETTYPEFAGRRILTTPLNRSSFLRRDFRVGLPLYGWAFDHAPTPRDAEVVVASTTGFAHGVRVPKGARKIVYCHSPARFLYLVEDYLGGPWWRKPVGWVLMTLRPALIAWDRRAAASADLYLCNSTVVRERIKRVYGLDAEVVNPSHGLDPAGPQEPLGDLEGQGNFYLVVSRLMPYKNVDVVVDAFRELPDEKLVVIGRGPLGPQLRVSAPGNVRFFEGVSDAAMRWAYAHAKAVIAPSREDYGLTPVEGFSFGTPCLALHAGGYLDTVVEGVSGWFFEDATPDAIRAAIKHLDAHPLPEEAVRTHAEKFSPEAFNTRMREAVNKFITQEGS